MTASDRALYVYALADPGLPSAMRIMGHRLRVLSLGAVDAVVERRDDIPDPSAENLRTQHAIVAELAAQTRALLPARFGSLVSDRSLRAVLSERESEILEALARVRDRRQMTIRVFGQVDSTAPDVERGLTGTAFLKSRHARAHHVPAEVRTICAALRSQVVAEKVEPGQGGLRVTIFHLVPQRSVNAYKKKAAALRPQPHQVIVSGPWPPFAFVPELF